MKNQVKLLVASLFIGGILAISTTANAADTTEGNVQYSAGSLLLDPQIQDDQGNLLPSLPTNLNFGSHPIQSLKNETWIATNDGTQDEANATTGVIRVRDNRGTNGGWSLKVNQVAQFTEYRDAGSQDTSERSVLSNALLTFYVGTGENNIDSNFTGTNLSSVSFPVQGADITVLAADADQGAGETSLPINKFELAVPAETNRQNVRYESTLKWTLSSTPGSDAEPV